MLFGWKVVKLKGCKVIPFWKIIVNRTYLMNILRTFQLYNVTTLQQKP